MHSVNIAEWILALVTSHDRAASTVGDLTEGAATRGVVWFWSGVLRTAASLLWRDVAGRPARLIGLAGLGLAVNIAIDLVFAGLTGVVFFGATIANGNPLHWGPIGWDLWCALPALISSLLIGRLLAHWAPGRELAACVVYAIVATIYNLAPMLGDNGAFLALLCVLIVPTGAAWGRNRRPSGT
ncbi:MAG: hypothetical protein WBY44_21510 [Bryobacteraceae bacterium]|jgi:hypothetical protein